MAGPVITAAEVERLQGDYLALKIDFLSGNTDDAERCRRFAELEARLVGRLRRLGVDPSVVDRRPM